MGKKVGWILRQILLSTFGTFFFHFWRFINKNNVQVAILYLQIDRCVFFLFLMSIIFKPQGVLEKKMPNKLIFPYSCKNEFSGKLLY